MKQERGEIKMINCLDVKGGEKKQKKKGVEDKEQVEENKTKENKNINCGMSFGGKLKPMT